MSFRSPLLLILLAVPLAALVAYVVAQRRPARHAIAFPNLWVLEGVVAKRPQWRRHLPAALVLATLVALTVSLARPTVTGAAASAAAEAASGRVAGASAPAVAGASAAAASPCRRIR